MPNTKSAMKAMRGSARKRSVNIRVKDRVKKELKELQKLVNAGNKKDAEAKLREVFSALDKAVKKKVVKKNTASRKKSRISKALAKLK